MKNTFEDWLESCYLYQFSNKKIISDERIEQVRERISFIEYINNKSNKFSITAKNRSFLRSLEIYLLLSLSDSLSNSKITYFPFENYINSKKNKDFILKVDKENKNMKDKILKIYSEYNKEFKVKVSFFRFWENCSLFIKRKIIACYHIKNIEYNENEYNEIIEDIFYKQYRNKFTHSGETNVPPVLYRTDNDFVRSDTELIGLSVKTDEKSDSIFIDIPLSTEEAEYILKNKYKIYRVLKNNDEIPIQIENAYDLVFWANNLNGYMDLSRYVNNGIAKIIKMALYEKCMQIEEKQVNWNEIMPFYDN